MQDLPERAGVSDAALEIPRRGGDLTYPGIIVDAPDRRLASRGELGDFFDLAQHAQNIARRNFLEVTVGEAAADEFGEQAGKQPTCSSPIGCGPPKKSEPMPT